MADIDAIQCSHNTNNAALNTNAEGDGVGGNDTLKNQDERYIIHRTIEDGLEIDYSPLEDGVRSAAFNNVPFGYMDAPPNGDATPVVFIDPVEY